MVVKTVLTQAEYDALPATLNKADVYGAKLDDGRFRIDAHNVDGWGVEDVAALKGAYGRTSKAAKDLEGEVAGWRAIGVPPDEVKAALEKVKQIASMTPDDKVQEKIAAVTKQLTDKYEKPLKEATEAQTALMREVERLTVDNDLNAALVKHGVDPEVLPIARDYARRFVKPEKNAKGQFYSRVVDGNGEPQISGKPGNHGDKTLDELVEELKAQKGPDRFFKGTGVSGGGMRPGAAASPNGSGVGFASVEDAKNPRTYERVREEAKKAGVDISRAPIAG